MTSGSGSWSGRNAETGECVRVTTSAGGRIEKIEPIAENAELPWLSSGWIDLQVNGCGGFDFNGEQASAEAVLGATRCLWSKGVVKYLPTVTTASFDSMRRSMSIIAAVRGAGGAVGASIGGIHMEGPYFSREDGPRGAHPLEHVRVPNLAEFDQLQQAANGAIKLVTLAPETSGAIAMVGALSAKAVVVSIGHTDASPACIAAAAAAGASMSTHLGNGTHLSLPRHPNYLWEQLADDRLCAGLIADGHHLPLSVLKTMLRAKRGKVFVVSDCMALAGMPPGEYRLASGEAVHLREDGRLTVANNPQLLAGSAQTLESSVRTLVCGLGLPVSEAVALVASSPAAAMGWSGCGRLVPGARADLTLFRVDARLGDVRVVETIVQGETVYRE